MSRHPYTYASDYIRHLAGYKHGQKAHCFNRGEDVNDERPGQKPPSRVSRPAAKGPNMLLLCERL